MSIMTDGFELTEEELDALFRDDSQESSPATDDTASDAKQAGVEETAKPEASPEDKVETTKAFAKRLTEKTNKAVAQERENIAKQMGFESYDAMIKSKEATVLENNGLDPESSQKAIDEIVKMRLDNDPRMKELDELKAIKVQEFGKQQLQEVTELTGGEITKLSQLPKAVIERWKECGSLKKAYLELEGENLVLKMRANQSKGTVAHLDTPSGNSSAIPNDMRTLNDKEKAAWKIFNPNITEEELNKKLTKK